MRDNDTPLTIEQARQLVTLPVGSRPRVYGEIAEGKFKGQIIAIKSEYYLDRDNYVNLYTTSMTEMDLIQRAI